MQDEDVPAATAMIDLPSWFWAGFTHQYLDVAQLTANQVSGRWQVRTIEDANRTKPNLMSVLSMAGPANDVAGFQQLPRIEAANKVPPIPSPNLAAELAKLERRAQNASQIGDPTPLIGLLQLQLITASLVEAPTVAEAVHEALLAIKVLEDPSRQTFPHAGVQLIHVQPALRNRIKLPSVLMRDAQDPRLHGNDTTHIQASNNAGEEVFASSSHLYSGSALLDAYVGPLLGAMAPWVWAFSVHRGTGAYVYTLGQPLAGTAGGAAELLQVLHFGGATTSIPAPRTAPMASMQTVNWWTKRLNAMFGAISDPATFIDAQGAYQPYKHLHSLLSVEQIFRRVASIQTAYRDNNARLVLMFTVLDTLADSLMTSRTFEEMCTLRVARARLRSLQKTLPAGPREVLLPAAERSVAALEELLDGFFISRQLGTRDVEIVLDDGTVQSMSREQAAALYMRLLRNATHGHGTIQANNEQLTNALLSHHDGNIPHDLPLLAYLYLLDILQNPEVLRGSLRKGKR